MEIRKPVINTFNRVGLNYESLVGRTDKVTIKNQFGFGSAEVTPLIYRVIQKVYEIGRAYERGDYSVKVADFDRLRYFVLAEDSKAYNICLD